MRHLERIRSMDYPFKLCITESSHEAKFALEAAGVAPDNTHTYIYMLYKIISFYLVEDWMGVCSCRPMSLPQWPLRAGTGNCVC